MGELGGLRNEATLDLLFVFILRYCIVVEDWVKIVGAPRHHPLVVPYLCDDGRRRVGNNWDVRWLLSMLLLLLFVPIDLLYNLHSADRLLQSHLLHLLLSLFLTFTILVFRCISRRLPRYSLIILCDLL